MNKVPIQAQVAMSFPQVEKYTQKGKDSKKNILYIVLPIVLGVLFIGLIWYIVEKKGKENYSKPNMGFGRQSFGFRFF